MSEIDKAKGFTVTSVKTGKEIIIYWNDIYSFYQINGSEGEIGLFFWLGNSSGLEMEDNPQISPMSLECENERERAKRVRELRHHRIHEEPMLKDVSIPKCFDMNTYQSGMEGFTLTSVKTGKEIIIYWNDICSFTQHNDPKPRVWICLGKASDSSIGPYSEHPNAFFNCKNEHDQAQIIKDFRQHGIFENPDKEAPTPSEIH